MFVPKYLYFTKINTSHKYKENDLEICAVELDQIIQINYNKLTRNA